MMCGWPGHVAPALLAALCIAGWTGVARGQVSQTRVEVTTSAREVEPGARLDLVIQVFLEKGWHIYGTEKAGVGIRTSVELDRESPFRLVGHLRGPEPKHEPAGGPGIPEYDYYDGKPEFRVAVDVPVSLPPGKATLKGRFRYQECTARSCRRPSSQDFELALTVRPAGDAKSGDVPGTEEVPEGGRQGGGDFSVLSDPRLPGAGEAESPGSVDGPGGPGVPQTGVPSGGFLAFLGFAVSAGLLTLLTPCVFPLVPVTISYFLKQASGDRRHTCLLSLTYGLGILGSFTALGFVLSVLLSANAARQMASNAGVNLVIGALFVFFAFSLFGAYELRLPGWLVSRLSLTGRGGYGGAVFLGLTFSVTAFTCTAPFASAVILAAVQGHYIWSLVGLLTYSGTMALPFFLLGCFPAVLTSLPKSGGWLNSVKVVFGFFELAAAFKFLANVDWQWGLGILTRPVVLSVWIVCAVFVTLYLLQLFRLLHDEPRDRIGVTRLSFALVFGAIALYLSIGLAGRPLPYVDGFLPLDAGYAAGRTGRAGGPGTGSWRRDISFDEARALAMERHVPLVVDLTAFSCVNCRVMETTVLADPEVEAELERFVSIRLYTDGYPPERALRNQKFQEEHFANVALPFFAFYDARGKLVRTHQGTAGKTEFLDLLRGVR